MGTQIADAALSVQDCAAQIAPDHLSWLRAYVVDSTQEEILKRIQKKGWAAAEKIPTYVRGHSAEYQSVPAKEGPWTHIDIPYVLDFGDYSGEGYVSFYMQPVGGRELVIAMGAMWSGEVYKQSDERQNVLKSVVIPSPGQSDVGQPQHLKSTKYQRRTAGFWRVIETPPQGVSVKWLVIGLGDSWTTMTVRWPDGLGCQTDEAEIGGDTITTEGRNLQAVIQIRGPKKATLRMDAGQTVLHLRKTNETTSFVCE